MSLTIFLEIPIPNTGQLKNPKTAKFRRLHLTAFIIFNSKESLNCNDIIREL